MEKKKRKINIIDKKHPIILISETDCLKKIKKKKVRVIQLLA